MRTHTLILLALGAMLLSCNTTSSDEAESRPAKTKRRAGGHGPRDIPGSAEEGSPELPPGHPPMGGQPGMPSDPTHGGGMPMGEMPTGEGEGPPLRWQAQDGWRSVQPSSSMRVAEWALAKSGGDAEDASMVVFHFAGGGDVQSNLDRWFGQFTQPDGRPTSEVAQVASRDVSGLRVTVADVSGTFAGGMMMGSGAPEPATKPNYRLLAAIVETPSGPWFFKLTGPKNTVEHWKASFDAFVGSLHQ